MKEAHTIYLDLDGVLWNFKQAWIDWFSWNSDKVEAQLLANTEEWHFYEGIITEADFMYRLKRLPVEFWNQPQYITPEALGLVKWAKDHAAFVKVLTVTGYDSACLKGKSKLVKKAFGLDVHGVEKAADKLGYAKDGCWLIDDHYLTVEKWLATGQEAAIWKADYNHDVGMDEYYFDKSKLEQVVKYTNVTDSPIMQTQPVDKKPVLDYDGMTEAKKRKMTPMYSGMLAYFPDALALVARNSMVGHYQHNDPEDEMYWDRTKSADELDAIIRHIADHSKNPRDEDGTLHMSKVCWRALAFVQKFIEEENDA